MKKKILILALLASASVAQAQTLDECQRAAEKHYPIIKRYDLIAKTTDLTVKNIQKGWLPQVTAAAQATYQSAVAAWPDHLQSMFQQVGLKMKGLRKDQYKLSIDVQQPIYDGGAISGQRKIASQEGKVQEAENEVNLYQVRRRVNELYFSLLLLDEQIKLNDDVKALLQSSEQKLSAMVKGGTAATSDYENVRAERLSAEQANESLKAQKEMLSRMLSLFCGIEITHLQKPQALDAVVSTNTRPEIRLFDNQLRLSEAQEKALDARLKPHLGLFAQGYYGYPGLNLFEDMMGRKGSWNALAGVKFTWNVGALYTHKNDQNKLKLQRAQTENLRNAFLFNNHLEQLQQQEAIQRYEKLMKNDDEIIALRTRVRKAAESKLAHGLIDSNRLVQEINQENAAKTQQSIHEINLLKAQSDLKYTVNGL